ncbi:DUF4280 domain-containing protein [Alkaliphilus crotonatoxidans]
MSAEKDEKIYVVRGARAKCSLGSMTCRLMIPLCHGVYIGGKPQLNINDYQVGLNISHFGFCHSKIPFDRETGLDDQGNVVCLCFPEITGPWVGGQDNDLIDGAPALTTNCINNCYFGGTITIEHHEQHE